MENLFDAGGYVAGFPMLLLGHPDATIKGLLQTTHPDGGLGIPVFTDEDRAQRFLQACPMPESYVLKVIKGPLEFLGLLCVLEAKGFNFVLFDPVGSVGSQIPIATVRQNVALLE